MMKICTSYANNTKLAQQTQRAARAHKGPDGTTSKPEDCNNAAWRLVAVIKLHTYTLPVHPNHPPFPSKHLFIYPSPNPTIIWHTHRARWPGIGG